MASLSPTSLEDQPFRKPQVNPDVLGLILGLMTGVDYSLQRFAPLRLVCHQFNHCCSNISSANISSRDLAGLPFFKKVQTLRLKIDHYAPTPTDLSLLTYLTSLTSLTLFGGSPLHQTLWVLTNLKYLAIEYVTGVSVPRPFAPLVHLSAKEDQISPEVLVKFKTLKTLALFSDRYSTPSLSPPLGDAALGELTNLTSLHLRDQAVRSPSLIKKLTSLSTLVSDRGEVFGFNHALNGECTNFIDFASSRRCYKYEGRFRDGEMTDKGLFTFPYDVYYLGGWYNGKMHGKGTMWKTSPTLTFRYQGDWLHGKKDGMGTYLHSWGTVYSGEKSLYEGTFVDNCYHGKGKIVVEELSGEFVESYDGEWKNDKKHGSGIYTDPSGTVQTHFENDSKIK